MAQALRPDMETASMQKLLCYLLLFISPAIYAQDKNESGVSLNNKYAAKLTIGPLFPLGVEYYFHDNMGVVLEAGLIDVNLAPYFLGIERPGADYFVKRYNFRLRTELRKYFPRRRDHRFFIGAEFYHHDKGYSIHNTTISTGSQGAFVAAADMKRIHDAIGFNWGMVSGPWPFKHKCLEWYIGVALERFAAYAGNVKGMGSWTREHDYRGVLKNGPTIVDYANYNFVGKYYIVRPSVGFKLSYVFGR